MLIGNHALIIGGSRGVGRATALELARRGADISLLYRQNHDAAQETVEAIEAFGVKAHAASCNIADAQAVQQALAEAQQRMGNMNMVVVSAGAAALTQAVHDQSPQDWANYMATDLNGTYHVVHHSLPYLREAGGGAIIAVTSIATQMMPALNSSGAAAKSAVEALLRVTAREEGKHNIRANAVSIGLTDTDLIKPILERWGPEATQRVLKGIPLQRIGTPEDVANMIAFLLDEAASYVTGKVIQVDGGQFIGG